MCKHQIFLSSSYSGGTRICLHFTDLGNDEISEIAHAIGDAYDGKTVPFSTHAVTTDSPDWESVIRTDPYFDDVKVLDSLEDFVQTIQKDRYLTGLDVARYILSISNYCTHTRLEKLTYMCYADYLCKYGEKLFDDKIYAFDFGPVIGSVYGKYCGQSRSFPTSPVGDSDDSGQIRRIPKTMPMKSRILFSEDGLKKIESIDASLKKYGEFSTEELIQMTHRDMTPWSVTDRTCLYSEMKDADIIKYHRNEI